MTLSPPLTLAQQLPVSLKVLPALLSRRLRTESWAPGCPPSLPLCPKALLSLVQCLPDVSSSCPSCCVLPLPLDLAPELIPCSSY